jgi:hypothetical protein
MDAFWSIGDGKWSFNNGEKMRSQMLYFLLLLFFLFTSPNPPQFKWSNPVLCWQIDQNASILYGKQQRKAQRAFGLCKASFPLFVEFGRCILHWGFLSVEGVFCVIFTLEVSYHCQK